MPNVIISDRNASSSYARFFEPLSALSELDFDLIYSTYWTDDDYFIQAALKTVDLFSRVKNTDHAEMIATVLYSCECLSQKENISDEDVYNFVLNWKGHWKNTKETEICDTIQNLSMLDWMNISFSGKLEYAVDM